MELQHPRDADGKNCPAYVSLGIRDDFEVDDGYVQVPEDELDRVRSRLAETYDVAYDGLTVEEDELEDLSHDELKELARDAGIAEETDLRTRENIIEAFRE